MGTSIRESIEIVVHGEQPYCMLLNPVVSSLLQYAGQFRQPWDVHSSDTSRDCG